MTLVSSLHCVHMLSNAIDINSSDLPNRMQTCTRWWSKRSAGVSRKSFRTKSLYGLVTDGSLSLSWEIMWQLQDLSSRWYSLGIRLQGICQCLSAISHQSGGMTKDACHGGAVSQARHDGRIAPGRCRQFVREEIQNGSLVNFKPITIVIEFQMR